MAEIRITWRVRGILKLFDSFTSKPAELSRIRVLMDEGLSVIKKPEGILVFVENHNFRKKEEYQVVLESPVFLPVETTLPDTEKPGVTVIWLRPGERYPAGPQSSKLYGMAEPGAEMKLVFTDAKDTMKLLSGYGAGDASVEIYHPGIRSLEGYVLEFAGKKYREKVKIGKELENSRPETGVYEIKTAPVKGTYPKMSTAVRIVYETRANETGMYTFFFRTIPEKSMTARLEMETGGAVKEMEAKVLDGKSVRLDWLSE